MIKEKIINLHYRRGKSQSEYPERSIHFLDRNGSHSNSPEGIIFPKVSPDRIILFEIIACRSFLETLKSSKVGDVSNTSPQVHQSEIRDYGEVAS